MIQSTNQYSLSVIQDKVRMLVEQGVVSRQQRILSLWRYIAAGEWIYVERELENSNFLLRDCIGDLIGWEQGEND